MADLYENVLWVRQPIAPGRGRPHFAGIHSRRQRRCLQYMLCQVCDVTTFARADGRHLFLLRANGEQPIAEGERTTAGPVCVPCAVQSVAFCPHLRGSYTAALVSYCPTWGVAGVVYDPDTLHPLSAGPDNPLELVAHDDPRISWTLAARYVVSLHGCEPVNVADLEKAEADTLHPPASGSAPGATVMKGIHPVHRDQPPALLPEGLPRRLPPRPLPAPPGS
ncbi:hypothetical protein [Actinacidiphila glaucinigra]|uniref:hypothetical protein n=1 Tax=Actinacidiphila glaucinigra TaxID=235986 RepID=UPI00118163E5|nr:hypothetical protein [Actinacidiphila glaucinigra]